MNDQPTVYRHTEEMGEISGFGGEYEECCQDMLEAGVKWLMEHKGADIAVSEMPEIYGIVSLDSEDAEKLSEVVVAASGGEATGAMHHAVMARLTYIAKHGWPAYVAELEKDNGDD